MMPLIARLIEIRHVRQKNCFARQKHGHVRARSFLGKIPDVPAAERGDGAYDHEEQNSFHKCWMLDAGCWIATELIRSTVNYPTLAHLSPLHHPLLRVCIATPADEIAGVRP